MTRWNLSKTLRLVAMLTLVAMATMGAHCGKNRLPRVFIPEENTAREQFVVADMQLRDARGIFDPRTRALEMRKAIVAFQAVEQRFPDDRISTPAASLLIGTIYQELEDYSNAVRQFERCLDLFPEDNSVRISALMGMGQCLDEMRQPIEAQKYYRQILDDYGNSTNPQERELVSQARTRYRQIRLLSQ